MRIGPGTVVVVTGASAGVGRAVALEFGRQGARLALLARDETRLAAVRREIEQLGTRAIAIPTDVADPAQVEAAADRVERELGPIGVWVNNAMVTIVAPVEEIAPEDFRRVSDVTYHGTVWGTMAAVKRMRPRGRGSIVQVGSALAYRSIPLQAPYCGAKHAVRGFTESVRTELIREKSGIRICMVELPGVNTPQFEWCKTTLPQQPQPLGAVYQPEVIARAIVWAASGRRREIFPTLSAALAVWADKVAPGLLDHFLADRAWEGQQSPEPVAADRPFNLWHTVSGDYGAHGRFDHRAKATSASLWVNQNRTWLAASALALWALWRLGARSRHD